MNTVIFTFGKLIFFVGVCGFLLFQFSTCSETIRKLHSKNLSILHSPACNSHAEIYSNVVDCQLLKREIEPTALDIAYWQCITHTNAIIAIWPFLLTLFFILTCMRCFRRPQQTNQWHLEKHHALALQQFVDNPHRQIMYLPAKQGPLIEEVPE